MTTRLSASALILLFLGTAVGTGSLTFRSLNTTYIPNAEVREWGEAVEKAVPPGESLLAPPLASYIRAATYRGVIADCKNIPYGGVPWAEWQERLKDLGGRDQCLDRNPQAYNGQSSEQLDRIAEKYDIRYMVVEQGQSDHIPELRELGWSTVLEPVNTIQNVVLHKTG